jgi:hypothetical protein
MSSKVPRKIRNVKAAFSASTAAGVELDSSNCTTAETMDAALKYLEFGFGKTDQSYTQGEQTDFASNEDVEKQKTGKDANNSGVNLKNETSLIENSIAAGYTTAGNNYYFSEHQGIAHQTSLTGTSVVSFVFGKSGPQAGYIPELVEAGEGITAKQSYAIYFPSTLTASMPINSSASFFVDIAGAIAPGESVRVYTASAANARVLTGSAFTYSGSLCSTPNYQVVSVNIPTASLPGKTSPPGNSGIVVVYSASYVSDGTKENTPYAGVVVTLRPSNVHRHSPV